MIWQRLRRGRLARGVLIVGSVVGVIAAGLAAVPKAGAGTEAGVAIVGVAGRCVDVSWSQTWDGAPIHLFDCNGTGAQKWAFDRETTSVRAFGKCLDVAGAAHADGTQVQLWECNGTGAQQWRFDGDKLVNIGSGKCLDAHGGSGNQTALQIWKCAGSPGQAWKEPTRGPGGGPKTDDPRTGDPRTGDPETGGAKKGVSTWAFPRVADGVREVRAAWYYDWSADNADVPAQAEFVPMIWGSGAVNDKDLAAAKKGTSLLGFNEPDRAEQANLSVDQALELWPRLEQTGLRLGSPAVASGADLPGGWLDRFLTGARERKLRVDFITVHWYGSDFGDAAADHFMGYVEAVHKRYGLPIWVTEFGLINFTGTPRYPSADQVTTFIGKATTSLEKAPYVERYAWFGLPAVGDSAEFGLYREDGTTTPAGVAYRDTGTPLPAVRDEPKPQPQGDDGLGNRMIELINTERARAGCPAVTKNAALTTAATAHSRLMADRRDLSHRLPGEADMGDRFTAAGYRWSAIAENITSGAFKTPEIAMYGKHDATADFMGFMESEGHRANILNCGLKEVGVGVVRDADGGPWWTQDFGSPS